uniref:Odorant binding protein 14 n=1 Tax=Grapholita molesta TaxID=192188 RepID=A0A2R4SBD9_GRAMO|nr:odorant binding protein 14 [Grapholita molesta]
MRYITALCLIFALECTCEVVIQLEPEKTAKVIESAVKCTGKYGLDLEVLQRLRNKERTKDEKFLKFLYCTLDDLKVVKKNGYYIEEEALKFVPKQHKALIKKALEECNKEPGKNRIDVLYNVSRCLEDKSNVRVTI